MTDRIALIFGAAHGIGRGIATSLARSGNRIMLSDCDEAAGQAAAKVLRDAGADASFAAGDVASDTDIAAVVAATASRFGGIDILVNCARPYLAKQDFPACMQDWNLAMDVLVKGPALATSYALPHLEKSGRGAVVNVSSTNAFHISHQPLPYHVAKAAVAHMTRHLAHELGPRGIRVNAICPALVDVDSRAQKLTDSAVNRKIVKAIVPLKRAATVDEIGDLAVFLCSGKAGYLTGQIIVIDGGMTLSDQFSAATRTIDAFKAGGADFPPDAV